jgi:hypothetical protein
MERSRLTVIDNQHHFPNVEIPDEFNTILRQGLDGALVCGRLFNPPLQVRASVVNTPPHLDKRRPIGMSAVPPVLERL